jgi:precorrin-8X/cobalt-precorrin-8 methylmutase
MPLFDAYVAVDWSAAKASGRGAGTIWIACRTRRGPTILDNPPTRDAATRRVRTLLHAAADAGNRVLVGFDFAYGYPRGFADAVAPARGRAPRWRRVWNELARLVVDDDDNTNNRHAVAVELNRRLGEAAFWGSGDARVPATKPRTLRLPELRIVERHLRRLGASPKAVWQLSCAGSVGSQTLLGIPRVPSLRFDPRLAPVSAVWPLETGLAVPSAAQIVQSTRRSTRRSSPRGGGATTIFDAHQVLSAVARWDEADRGGTLTSLLGRPVEMDDDDEATVVDEEGWILGATALLPHAVTGGRHAGRLPR